ncbi:MAG: FAD binding domain-containing protein [Aeromicrobium sp.]
MKLPDIDYVRPADLAAAAVEVARPGSRALAGGQSLVPGLVLGEVRADRLVDLTRLAELRGIEVDDRHLRIGALEPMWDVERHALVLEHAPHLADVLGSVGAPPIRSRATLGGSLAWADPVSQLPAGIAALGFMVVTTERTVTAGDLVNGATTLTVGELIVRLELPLLPRRCAYELVRRTHITWPVCGASVVLEPGLARVALHGAGPHHVVAEDPDPEEAVRRACALVAPVADTRASAEYRRRVVPRLAARALRRASEESP